MIRDKLKLSKTGHILLALSEVGGMLYQAQLYGSLRHSVYPGYAKSLADNRTYSLLYELYKRGLIKFEYKEAKRVIKLTSKGQLEALFKKSKLIQAKQKWDGKWRLVIFDIPEHAKPVREKLRKLLLGYGFKGLQASVYIYPFALNADAVEYLNHSGLSRYIRFLRVDAIDSDAELRKLFKKLL